MTVEDLAANRAVRAVFARNWVNTQRLDYGATHGTVYVRGRLTLLRRPAPDSSEERDRSGVGPKFLLHLEKEIKKVDGVRNISWQLDSWQRAGSAWLRSGL